MKLKELLSGVPTLAVRAGGELEINDVSYDSRKTVPGGLFVAISGYAMDGHAYIPKAVEAGAVCVVCERPPEIDVPFVQVAESRRALALIGANWFGHPAERMTLTAVTGTNGKTTTTYLLKDILERARGTKAGLIGTNQNMIGDLVLHTDRTTPECFELHKLFRQMLDAGCTHVVMETSSHALYEGRVHGIHFDAAVFTNLSQDHLDFHVTMENYCDAKAILFQNCDTAVVNADDPWTGRLLTGTACRKETFGKQSKDLWPENIDLKADHVSFDAVTPDGRIPVWVGIPGEFTVYNALGAMAAAEVLGVPLEESARVLRDTAPVKGRLEPVPTPGKDYGILIDYAVTPDAIENVLAAVRGFARGRIVFLFGAGGDRDRGKRPKMGKAAAEGADFLVVTSDNPRTEDPEAIIREILPGVEAVGTPYVSITDRVEAIHYAMDHALPGDTIVLCGKGHEDYQEINHVKYHMDEREIVADWLNHS